MKLVTQCEGVQVVDTEKCYYFGIHHEYDNETFKIHAILWLDVNEGCLKIGRIDAEPEQAQYVEDIINDFILKMINKIFSSRSNDVLNLTSEWKEMISND